MTKVTNAPNAADEETVHPTDYGPLIVLTGGFADSES
jgi:hypothetical protein